MMVRAGLLQLCIAAGCWLQCSNASAFSQPSYYVRASERGGGGGHWFTGTSQDGYTCAVCHTGDGKWTLHVEGLPDAGYVPGTRYDVRITWPEFSARADQIHATMPLTAMTRAPGDGPELAGPDMSVLAELTNADGFAAGRLEMDYDDIASETRRDEWCMHLDGVPASQLFDTSATAPDQPSVSCTATLPMQRCVLAVQVCGARTLRFGWVAPPASTGPVWFNAAMVATEALNADPTQDAVTFVRHPISPIGSASQDYVSHIDHGCAVAAPLRAHASGGQLSALLSMVAVICLARSSKRVRAARRGPREIQA